MKSFLFLFCSIIPFMCICQDMDISDIIKKAEAGNPKCMGYLACSYYFGSPEEGIDNNPELAFNWGIKAAEKNDPIGMSIAGACYISGEGVEINRYKGIELLEKSTHYESPMSDFAPSLLGACYEDDELINEAAYWYKMAADEIYRIKGEFVDSEDNLAYSALKRLGINYNPKFPSSFPSKMYRYPNFIIENNLSDEDISDPFTRFFSYVRAAAGDVGQQMMVGVYYITANIDNEDMVAKGVKWLKLAASQGLGQAYYYLGYLYENLKVSNYDMAHIYYMKAAEYNIADAMLGLARLYSRIGEPQAEEYWSNCATISSVNQGSLDQKFLEGIDDISKYKNYAFEPLDYASLNLKSENLKYVETNRISWYSPLNFYPDNSKHKFSFQSYYLLKPTQVGEFKGKLTWIDHLGNYYYRLIEPINMQDMLFIEYVVTPDRNEIRQISPGETCVYKRK